MVCFQHYYCLFCFTRFIKKVIFWIFLFQNLIQDELWRIVGQKPERRHSDLVSSLCSVFLSTTTIRGMFLNISGLESLLKQEAGEPQLCWLKTCRVTGCYCEGGVGQWGITDGWMCGRCTVEGNGEVKSQSICRWLWHRSWRSASRASRCAPSR